MDFRKKLKIRFYSAILFIVIGIALISVCLFNGNDTTSSIGLMFIIMGIARVKQYKHITKNEETCHKREIAETDERNVKIWTNARSLAFSIYIIIACAGIILLYLINLNEYALMLSWNVFAATIIYWICYFIIRKIH